MDVELLTVNTRVAANKRPQKFPTSMSTKGFVKVSKANGMHPKGKVYENIT